MNRIRQATTSRQILDALIEVLKEKHELIWDEVTQQETRKEILIRATKHIIDKQLLDYVTLTSTGVRMDVFNPPRITTNPYLWLADEFPVRDKMIDGHLGIVLKYGDRAFAVPYAERLIERLKTEK